MVTQGATQTRPVTQIQRPYLREVRGTRTHNPECRVLTVTAPATAVTLPPELPSQPDSSRVSILLVLLPTLCPHKDGEVEGEKSSPGRIRTADHRLSGPPLCSLSHGDTMATVGRGVVPCRGNSDCRKRGLSSRERKTFAGAFFEPANALA